MTRERRRGGHGRNGGSNRNLQGNLQAIDNVVTTPLKQKSTPSLGLKIIDVQCEWTRACLRHRARIIGHH